MAVIGLAFALMVSSIGQKSATVDEQSHLFRGIAYVREGATHFLLGHPLGGGVIAALPLLTEPNLVLPVESPAWAAGNWSLAGNAFLWQVNENPQRLIFLGRLPIIWLTLLFGALLFRWGKQLAGVGAGLVAQVVLLLDPNVLAHGRLITDDMPVAAAYCLTIYGFWGWSQAPAPKQTRWLWLTGLGLGLAAWFKFSAALLWPTLLLLALWLAWQQRRWRPLLALIPIGVIGWGFLWLVYGLALRPLPGGAFWDDLFWVTQYFDQPHGAYLLGAYSTTGWWYYFPLAYLLKTPLPTLLLLLLAGGAALYRWWQGEKPGPTALFLLLPALLYALTSLTTSLNIGYRHLLPLLPFLALAAAVSLSRMRDRWRWGGYGLAAALPLLALFTWPDFLPFFNRLAGGPQNGWRLLSDSNVDWGQDLPALAAWQQEKGVPLYLSYFGTAHPSVYGVEFTPLPTWAPGPEQGNPAQQLYNPADPAPGFYAISVTNLHGVVLGDERDLFAGFRGRTPVARIGGSIFVYKVEPSGPPVDVLFSGTRPGTLAPPLWMAWGTNEVRPRWLDVRTSWLWPENGGWLAVDGARPQVAELAAFWPDAPVQVVGEQQLYRLPASPQLPWADDEYAFGPLIYLGYIPVQTSPGDIALLTAWRVAAATPHPWKIFVHALDEQGEIIIQWDGLDATPSSWQLGDLLVQLHQLTLPDAAAPVRLLVGVYDGETGVRPAEPLVIIQE